MTHLDGDVTATDHDESVRSLETSSRRSVHGAVAALDSVGWGSIRRIVDERVHVLVSDSITDQLEAHENFAYKPFPVGRRAVEANAERQEVLSGWLREE